LELAVVELLIPHKLIYNVFQGQYRSILSQKSGIDNGASLDVGVGYLDVAEKQYSQPPTLIQQSYIEMFQSPKRFVFSLLNISFTFFSQ
jgi:hypothetical protein